MRRASLLSYPSFGVFILGSKSEHNKNIYTRVHDPWINSVTYSFTEQSWWIKSVTENTIYISKYSAKGLNATHSPLPTSCRPSVSWNGNKLLLELRNMICLQRRVKELDYWLMEYCRPSTMEEKVLLCSIRPFTLRAACVAKGAAIFRSAWVNRYGSL